MYRTRTTNVSAAQWSPNGGTLGALDLTEPSNQVFGYDVFGPAAQRERLPKTVYQALQDSLSNGYALDPALARAQAAAL